MITDREMFCTISGVIVTVLPPELRAGMLISAGKEFGISEEEGKKIISETKKTLAFVITKMLKKKMGKMSKGFDI